MIANLLKTEEGPLLQSAWIAIKNADLDAFSKIIKKMRIFDLRKPLEEYRAGMTASQTFHTENLKNISLLHLCIYVPMAKQTIFAQHLIGAGCGVHICDSNRATALHWAVQAEAYELIKALLIGKAAINARDYAGRTPLHIAAMKNDRKSIELLQIHGASVSVKDNLNFLARDYAYLSFGRNATYFQFHKLTRMQSVRLFFKFFRRDRFDIGSPRELPSDSETWEVLGLKDSEERKEDPTLTLKEDPTLTLKEDPTPTLNDWNALFDPEKASDIIFSGFPKRYSAFRAGNKKVWGNTSFDLMEPIEEKEEPTNNYGKSSWVF